MINVNLTQNELKVIQQLVGLLDDYFMKKNNIKLSDNQFLASGQLYDLAQEKLYKENVGVRESKESRGILK